MRTKVFIALLTLIIPTQSHAVMGVGDIVTDPGAYGYYAEQITVAQEALDTARETLTPIIETKDFVLGAKRNLEGTLRRAERAVAEFERLRDYAEKNPLAFGESIIKSDDDITDYLDKTDRKIKSVMRPVGRSMDELNKLVGTEDEPADFSSNWVGVKQAQNAFKAKQLEKTLVNAEKANAMIGMQLDDLDKLSNWANTANTQKDATDVTNAILLKMQSNLQTIIELLADMNRSYSLVNYDSEAALSGNQSDVFKALYDRLDDESSSRGSYQPNGNEGLFNPFGNDNPFN